MNTWTRADGRAADSGSRIGVHDNFFDLGGNSLLLIEAQNAVNRAFGCELPVVDLFAHPTVQDLAHHLAALTGPDASPTTESQTPPAAGNDPSGLDRAKERAQKQRAARALRTARHGKDR